MAGISKTASSFSPGEKAGMKRHVDKPAVGNFKNAANVSPSPGARPTFGRGQE